MNPNRLAESTDPAAVRNAMAEAVGRVAFDVGANHGQSARLLAQHFEQVVSFEPCAESFEELIGNVPDNVLALPYALTSRNGPLELTETENSIRTGQLTTGVGLNWGPKVGTREVIGYTLDTICLQLQMVPDFVKIDVEGHEAEVVKGGRGLFAGPAPTVFIEVHHRRYVRPIYTQLFDQYDFEVIDYGVHAGLDASEGHFWVRGVPR
jgi:FkbM family methyltransferase